MCPFGHINDDSPPDPTDAVFRALADPSRRRMLDLIKQRPGLNVNDLTEHFAFTRFAVMKHLRVLRGADLVLSRRVGKERKLFLNPIPIQSVYDRWISQYSARWASSLTALKYELEDQAMTESLQQIHQIYIRTTPEKLWEALTRAEHTQKYFYGTSVRSSFEPGGPIEYIEPSGVQGIVGEILASEPPKRLVFSFRFPNKKDAATKVTYEIEPMGAACRLTVLHEGFLGETETFKSTSEGWKAIVSGLKTWLETGEQLVIEE